MKKKLSLILAATTGVFVCGITKVQAQVNATQTVQCNVNLKPELAITVNQSSADFDFTTNTDYTNGVTVAKADHVTISCTGGFAVTVKADGDLTYTSGTGDPTSSGGSTTIPISDIQITASQGSTTGSNVAITSPTFASATPLSSASGVDVATSASGVTSSNISVSYFATGGNDFLKNASTSSSTANVYVATLTYTITAQ